MYRTKFGWHRTVPSPNSPPSASANAGGSRVDKARWGWFARERSLACLDFAARSSVPSQSGPKNKAVEPFRIVVANTRGEDRGFPRGQRKLAAVQLFENRLQTFRTFDAMFRISALPCEEKAIKILRRDRLNFRAQPIDREPMNSRQQPAVAPLLISRVRAKVATQHKSFRFEGQ